MRFLVVGSLHGIAKEPNEIERFQEACREMGQVLSSAGHTLVVGSDSPRSADKYFVEGANRAPKGRKRVLVYRPEHGETPFADAPNEYPNIDFSYERSKGPWAVGRVHQILAADGLILVGGESGTLQAGYSAPMLQRPVLAIPSFGGGAAQAWEHFEADYRRLGGTAKEADNLREKWHRGHADLVIRVLEDLVKRNPYKTAGITSQLLLLSATLLLLCAWVALFVRPVGPNTVTFFLLLGISALVGSGLRTALRVSFMETATISARQTVNEVTVGLVLAFGLALVYLSGGLVITGKLDFVKLASDDDFVRVSITMSLLGLASSLLIEGASTRLKDVLSKAISGHTT